MVQGLDKQMQAKRAASDLDMMRKEAEKQATAAAITQSMERELAKTRHKRQEEEKLQQELLNMMQDKVARERAEGTSRPLATSTMVSPAFPRTTTDSFSKQLDASRYVSKPMGRIEGMPLDASSAELRRMASMGRAKSADGSTRTPQAKNGGGQHMAKAIELAHRDIALDSHWHEGLTAAHKKAGKQAALAREKAHAVMKDPIASLPHERVRRSN